MPSPPIICPRCGRGRVGHDGYTCTCGQRFRLPREGKIRFFPETEAHSLFWVPGSDFYLDIHQILALPELEGVDREATAIELPAMRLRAAADLALARGGRTVKWRGRRD